MSFEFTAENRQQFETIVSRYPVRRAAMLPTLHLAQEQHGYITPEVEEYVAGLLEVPVVDVREVISFYSLFSQKPFGRHHVKVCMSIACWVRGCDRIAARLEELLGVPPGETTDDGLMSWEAVPDCLGACELAPMLQLDGYFEGPLTTDDADRLVARCRSGGNGDGDQNGTATDSEE